MAIVEMKRIAMLAMCEDQDRLLAAMQRMGCVHIVQAEEGDQPPESPALERADGDLAQLRWAIAKLGPYDRTKKPLFAQPPEVDEAGLAETLREREALMALVGQTEQCERRMGELRTQETRCLTALEQLKPYLDLDVPVERLTGTRETVQWTGMVETRALPALQDALAGQPALMQILRQSSDGTALWILAHRAAAEAVGEAVKQSGFAQAQFPKTTGTPKAQQQDLRGELDAIERERADIKARYEALAQSLPELQRLFDAVGMEQARHSAAQRFAATRQAFYCKGWVPATRAEKVADKLRSLAPACVVEISEPREDEEPPVLLHNPGWAEPYESIVSGYSLPAPGGLDPTVIMAPFFACYFGMMLSDAGYGLVLALGIPLILKAFKIKNVKLPWVLFGGGLFTVFWGAMFDTWFGASIKPMLLNPLTDTLPMMLLCLGMGVLHLLAGMFTAAYMNIKRGKPLDALYDQGFWVLLIAGALLLLLPQTAAVGKYLALGSVAGILLTAGRANRNPVKRLLGGLGALYNVTGWLSDILSYLRLFGMGLATGVVGMVINTLVGMMMTNVVGILIGIPILIFGHAFNMGINALGAYVHACRLQYIEFFGKFYEDGGKPFLPLRQNLRYATLRAAGADE